MRRSSQTPFLVALTLFLASLHPTATLQNSNKFSPNYLPLNLLQISTAAGPAFEAMTATRKISAFNYPPRLSFQRTSIGTPSQFIRMVLDTGSQLSWMSCDNKTNPKASFQHNRSKTFSYTPRRGRRRKQNTHAGLTIIPSARPAACDYYHRCLYSYFYALLYSVPLVNITVGRKSVVVPPVSDNGAGQTIIDSGTQFTYLADDVYNGVAKLVSGLAGSKLPKGYDHFPLCFRNTSENIGKRVGDLLFVFENRPRKVSVSISKGNLFIDVRYGVCCFTILWSGVFGDTSSNIIGNVHQQNLWIE